MMYSVWRRMSSKIPLECTPFLFLPPFLFLSFNPFDMVYASTSFVLRSFGEVYVSFSQKHHFLFCLFSTCHTSLSFFSFCLSRILLLLITLHSLRLTSLFLSYNFLVVPFFHPLFFLSQDQGLVNYCSIVDVYVKLPSFRILHM